MASNDELRAALETIAALRGYTGTDTGRVAGYRVAAGIAEKALAAFGDGERGKPASRGDDHWQGGASGQWDGR